MLSDEEKKAIEQAISSVTRGVDIESAILILEKCALDGLVITGGRINIFKIAVRQIVEFLKEYKDKGYLDVVREKVKANETVEKQSKEIEELKEYKHDAELTKVACCTAQNCEALNNCIKLERELQNADKKWEDKIKARIEELEEYLYKGNLYKGNIKDDFLMIRIKAKIQELQSLLEKE